MTGFPVAIVLRATGICLGLFLVLVGITTAAGLVPGSTDGSASFNARLAAGSVPLLVGVVLLLPHKYFALGLRHAMLLGAYALVALVTLALAVAAIMDFGAGSRHWLIVPTSLVLFGIPFANGVLLWSAFRRQGQRSQSTPSR